MVWPEYMNTYVVCPHCEEGLDASDHFEDEPKKYPVAMDCPSCKKLFVICKHKRKLYTLYLGTSCQKERRALQERILDMEKKIKEQDEKFLD